MIEYADGHDGYVFVVWDEGNETNRMPFLAIGCGVKVGPNATALNHSSLLKSVNSVEELFDVPVLASVTDATDFAELFEPGAF